MLKVIYGAQLLDVVVGEIREAREQVRVAMFEWAWYPGMHTGSVQDINRELCIKAKNGYKVKVLLHNEAMGRVLHKMNRKTAGHLRNSKAEVRWGNTGKPLHAKVWIFDDNRVVIGSHNISARSVRTNLEVSVLCDVREVVESLAEWFEGLWAKGM